ncbi:MAG: hypothetical protein AAF225_04690 [Pseudomonadota bacterium]
MFLLSGCVIGIDHQPNDSKSIYVFGFGRVQIPTVKTESKLGAYRMNVAGAAYAQSPRPSLVLGIGSASAVYADAECAEGYLDVSYGWTTKLSVTAFEPCKTVEKVMTTGE